MEERPAMNDSSTPIQELKDKIREFCKEREWGEFHGPKDLAIGAVTESSELLEIFRFQSEAQCEQMLRDPVARQNIADEMADVLFFLARMSEKYEFDLSRAFEEKLEKTAKKYPVDKSKGSNKKYTAYSSN
jgi:NTP pyrophosphatase (non-canonical NTP hydrolase)